ncbi:MAG: nucleotidyltransferase family protein [Arenicella sp.]|nr:nucleotidyltransferase family protein [Arenicella sp.]
MNLSIVVLAAGSSRRFGSSKMQHVMSDGRVLLEHSLDIYESVGDTESVKITSVIVVLPPDNASLKKIVEARGVIAKECPDSHQGMSASIKAGLSHAVSSTSNLDACLIALGDMPYGAPKTIDLLINSAQPNKIIIPYQLKADGKLKNGNPVIFGKEFFPEVFALQGDKGAKSVLDTYGSAQCLIEVQDPGIFQDIDSPKDLINKELSY